MVQPLNYIINTPDPVEKAMRGFAQGEAIRNLPVQREREAATFARDQEVAQQENQLFAQGQTLFNQGQEDRQEAERVKAELSALFENPNTSGRDIARFIASNPSIKDEVVAGWELLDADNQEATMLGMAQTYSAMEAGNTQLAGRLMSDRVNALREEGRTEEADYTASILEMMVEDPAAAKTQLGIVIGAIGGDVADQTLTAADNAMSMREREVKLRAQAADIGLAEAKTDEIVAELAEVEAGNAGMITDPKEVAEQEDKLRKEYEALISDVIKVESAYRRIEAVDDSAAGDLAMIFNFMKMLDPGSVVRESEFATAQNSAGVPDRIRNTYNRALEGTRLAPDQRVDFKAQAEQLMAAATLRRQEVIPGFERIVENRGLNANNVFLIDPNAPEEDVTQTDDDIAAAILGGG